MKGRDSGVHHQIYIVLLTVEYIKLFAVHRKYSETLEKHNLPSTRCRLESCCSTSMPSPGCHWHQIIYPRIFCSTSRNTVCVRVCVCWCTVSAGGGLINVVRTAHPQPNLTHITTTTWRMLSQHLPLGLSTQWSLLFMLWNTHKPWYFDVLYKSHLNFHTVKLIIDLKGI